MLINVVIKSFSKKTKESLSKLAIAEISNWVQGFQFGLPNLYFVHFHCRKSRPQSRGNKKLKRYNFFMAEMYHLYFSYL